ncbi:HNH endonuclease [Yangia mangrovi]|uniref:HNH endonuclease n=1 Tax=Alloyangia mangrovi TaxID=1779329 RepID=A0A2A3K1W2_9RHOB|nr:HNH endonuclease [Alloyangia mangrovi]MCT4369079.1 HNH endonuclease [Alloyangia mangrovi]
MDLAKQNKSARKLIELSEFDGDDCLIWPLGRDAGGYGRAKMPGFTTRLAHRIMCELKHGTPPFPDAVAMHRCGNGHLGCVNPNHLSWGTVAENNEDKRAAGNQPIGESSGNARLDTRAIRRIREMRSKGASQRVIAAAFDVHPATVQAVLEGRTWGHVS